MRFRCLLAILSFAAVASEVILTENDHPTPSHPPQTKISEETSKIHQTTPEVETQRLNITTFMNNATIAKEPQRIVETKDRRQAMLEVSRNGGIENSNDSGEPARKEVDEMTKPNANASGSEEAIQARRKETNAEVDVEEDSDVEPREEDFMEAADFGIKAMNDLYYVKEPKLYSMGIFLSPDNPARYVAAFNEQTDEAKQLAKYGYAALEAARKLRSKYPDISRQATNKQNPRKSLLRQNCPKKGIPQCPPASLRYRTADGSCNNRQELWWGSSMSTMQRFLSPVYDDNIQSIRSSVTGGPLPSAREISDYIHQDRDAPAASVTHMLMQWGQFIDHDITATGQSRAFNGSVPQCCLNGGRGFQPPESMHPECLPIVVTPRDRHLSKMGVRCMEFVRSGPAPRDGCEFGSREQLSQVTSFIDASTVYSSSARQSDSLRIFRNGLLQYGKIQSRRPVLPRDDSDLCRRGSLSTSCFRAGDNRLSEQPALTSLHVVFLRLHNRLATQFAALNQHWGDEKIFQETRRVVSALVQHITYREFLPIVLGHDVMKIFEIELVRKGYYEGYDPTIEPNIANAFSTAAFRFGHSLVQNSFIRFDRKHIPILNNVTIHAEFSHPANLESVGSVDRILLGLVNQPAQTRDQFISEELTNHLFQTPGFPFGMDLASLNIQRGRDHGIPPYVDWRQPCGLSSVREWNDLERVMSTEAAQKFKDLYAAVEDVDLFSAGLAEKPVADGLVGPTFACIIAQQFRSLKKGDRFWYENPFLENGFTPEQLQQIRRITLSRILCRTMDNIDNIQPFVMLAADNLRNQRLPCEDPLLDQIDLDAWIERPQRRESTDADLEVDGVDGAEEEKFEVKEGSVSSPSSITDTAAESRAAAQKQSNQRAPQKPKPPVKTRINQHNRITVKRPLGPHENLTIVVNNNAVNAPVFVSDSIYGSNFQLNHYPNAERPPQRPPPQQQQPEPQRPSFPNYEPSDVPHYTTRKPQTSQRPYEHYFPSANAYYPHNFDDPNNPNPPNYGLNAKPPNNFYPNNEFFAYNVPNLPGNLPSLGQNQYTGNQQDTHFTTKKPGFSTKPSSDHNNYFDSQQESYFTTKRPGFSTGPLSEQNNYGGQQESYFTTKRPRPPYQYQPNIQHAYAEYNQETDQLEEYYDDYRPTKKPKPKPTSPNRRYTQTRPQVEDDSEKADGYQRPSGGSTRPSYGSTEQLTSTLGSSYPQHQTKPATGRPHVNYNLQKEEVDVEMPHYLHTLTTVSNVQYVPSSKPQRQKLKNDAVLPQRQKVKDAVRSPQRHKVKDDIQLPRPISSLQNRESDDHVVKSDSNTHVNKKRHKLTTIVPSGDDNGLDSTQPILKITLEKSASRMSEDTLSKSTAKVPLEISQENELLFTTSSNELPRPMKIRHGR